MLVSKAWALSRSSIIAIALSIGCSSSSTAPSTTASSSLTEGQSAADSKSFTDRREKIQAVTGLSTAAIKPLETTYEVGTIHQWVKLDEKQRTIVCMFNEYRPGTDDSSDALWLAAVWLQDSLMKSAKDVVPDSPMTLKEFINAEPMTPLATEFLVRFEGVTIDDPVRADQVKRAARMNSKRL